MARIVISALVLMVSLVTGGLAQEWEWQNPYPTEQSMMDVFSLGPDECWAVGGNILHTTDGGATWDVQCNLDYLGLWCVTFADHLNGWAGGNEGLMLHTSDGGATWQQQVSGVTARINDIVCLDPQNAWAATGGAVLRTANGGATWNMQLEGPNPLEGVDFVDPLHGWVVGNVPIFGSWNGWIERTTDGGATWTNCTPDSIGDLIEVDFVDALSGWVVGSNTVAKTTDGGVTWIHQAPGQGAFWEVQFDNTLEGRVLHLGGAFYRTVNGGDTWEYFSTGTLHYLSGLSFGNASSGWAVGDFNSNGGSVIRRTTDGGQTWQDQHSSVTGDVSLVDVSFIGTNGWVCGSDGTLLHTPDGGITWGVQSPGTAVGLRGIDFINELSGWMVGDSGAILHTIDGGTTWLPQPSGTYEQLAGVDFFDELHGSAVGSNATYLRTTDGGQSWTPYDFPPGSNPGLGRVQMFSSGFGVAIGNQYVYQPPPWGPTRFATLYRTLDGGLSWTLVYSGTSRIHYDFDFVDESNGWLVGVTPGGNAWIRHTTNGGTNWEDQYIADRSLIGIHFLDAQNGLAVGDGGTIVRTSDGGETWVEECGYGAWLDDVWVSPDGVWVVGLGGSILHRVNGLGVPPGGGQTRPASYSFSVYPNPFNMSTVIKFDLAWDVQVRVIIYNTLGRQVATLVDGRMRAGSYQIDWSPGDLPSGIYFCRLTTDIHEQTIKLALLK